MINVKIERGLIGHANSANTDKPVHSVYSWTFSICLIMKSFELSCRTCKAGWELAVHGLHFCINIKPPYLYDMLEYKF